MKVLISASATSVQMKKAKEIEKKGQKKIDAMTKALKELKAGLKAAKAIVKKGTGTATQIKEMSAAHKHVKAKSRTNTTTPNVSRHDLTHGIQSVAPRKAKRPTNSKPSGPGARPSRQKSKASGPMLKLKPAGLAKALVPGAVKAPIKGGYAYRYEVEGTPKKRNAFINDIKATLKKQGFDAQAESGGRQSFQSNYCTVIIGNGRGVGNILIKKA